MALAAYEAGVGVLPEQSFESIQKERTIEAVKRTLEAFFDDQDQCSVITYEGLMGGAKTTAALLTALEAQDRGYKVKVYGLKDNRFNLQNFDKEDEDANEDLMKDPTKELPILFSREPGIANPYKPVVGLQEIVADINLTTDLERPNLIVITEAAFMEGLGDPKDPEDLGMLPAFLNWAKENGIKLLFEGLGAYFTGEKVINMEKLIANSNLVFEMRSYCSFNPTTAADITSRYVRIRDTGDGNLEIHPKDREAARYYSGMLYNDPNKLIYYYNEMQELKDLEKLKLVDEEGVEWLRMLSHPNDDAYVLGHEIYLPVSRKHYQELAALVGIEHTPREFTELYRDHRYKFHVWKDLQQVA